MDNTTLTLVVAAIGAASALLGAAAGGLAAIKGAKHSGTAMLAQVQQQATAEHSRWLRERRHECSVTLRQLLDEVMHDAAILNGQRTGEINGPDPEESSERVLRDVLAAGSVLDLLGPGDLAIAGNKAAQAAGQLLVEAGKDGWNAAMHAVLEAQSQFTKQARIAAVTA
ncbi:hypothetical protein ABZS93_11570 [Streptomyces sp900116325]|uniref:hypothetical protein n=1 Tax=Streptomyces sp. 900116325 TaxID=3154295 RepID=UPI0033AA8334